MWLTGLVSVRWGGDLFSAVVLEMDPGTLA